MRHSRAELNILTVSSAVIAIAGSFLFPTIADTLAPWLLLASILIIGMQHGAIDHKVAEHVYGLKRNLRDQLRFYLPYLAGMGVIALLWIFWPVIGMAVFLLMSAYHWGQADAIALSCTENRPHAIHNWSRGLMVIGLIVYIDPSATFGVIDAAVRGAPDWFIQTDHYSGTIIGILICAHLLLTGYGINRGHFNLHAAYLLIDNALLIALLLTTHPFIGFAIYFALWHSCGHVEEMMDFFNRHERSMSWIEFYKLSFPFTLISFLALIPLIYVFDVTGPDSTFLAIIFILISALTLPHMFIVDRMYIKKAPPVNSRA